jgi:hypothetical protein
VSLIHSNSKNLIRHALAPLAASIAANNVVILATAAGHNHALIACLIKEWTRYLSPDSAFLVPGVSPTDIQVNGLDHIVILGTLMSYSSAELPSNPSSNRPLDESPSDYSAVLRYPEAHFHSVATGYNLAVVDEGKKDWNAIAGQISDSSRNQSLPCDRLSAVIIRTADVPEFRKALMDQLTTDKEVAGPSTPHAESHIPDCTSWGKKVLYFNAAPTKGSGGRSEIALERNLRLAQAAEALLVVTVTSLDKGLDLINNLSDPILQLALLAPGSKDTVAYVRNWCNAYTLSVGSIRTVLPPRKSCCPIQLTRQLNVKLQCSTAAHLRHHWHLFSQPPFSPVARSLLSSLSLGFQRIFWRFTPRTRR